MADTPAPQGLIGDLADIEMVSGLAQDAPAVVHPFVTITATGMLADGTQVRLVGQLDVAQVRVHAMAYLEAAEGADHDAAFARFLLMQGLDMGAIAPMVSALRDFREPDESAVPDGSS